MSAPTPRPRSEWRPLPAGWSWAVTGDEPYAYRCGTDVVLVVESLRGLLTVPEPGSPIPVVLAVLHAAGYDVPEVTS
jgi:hypothetical protein